MILLHATFLIAVLPVVAQVQSDPVVESRRHFGAAVTAYEAGDLEPALPWLWDGGKRFTVTPGYRLDVEFAAEDMRVYEFFAAMIAGSRALTLDVTLRSCSGAPDSPRSPAPLSARCRPRRARPCRPATRSRRSSRSTAGPATMSRRSWHRRRALPITDPR